MNLDDFRGMRRGIQLSILNQNEASLLEPVSLCNGKKQNALLLLHGFSSTPAVYRRMLPSFSDYDAIIVPALPGHAENLEAFARMKITNVLKYAEQICQPLVDEFQHVDVMGLSMGGVVACHLASLFSFHHLYLLAPAFDLRLSTGKMLKLARCLDWLGFCKLRSKAGNLYTLNECEFAYRQLPLSSIMEILTLIEQFPFTLPSCPTDLFLGRYDEVVATDRVARRFADSSHSNIHWLEHSAHVLPMDGDVETICNCVRQNMAR